jgi:hypothetical protein
VADRAQDEEIDDLVEAEDHPVDRLEGVVDVGHERFRHHDGVVQFGRHLGVVGERPAGRAERGRRDNRLGIAVLRRPWRSIDSSELRGPVDWPEDGDGEASKEPTKFIVGLAGRRIALAGQGRPAGRASPTASAAADAVNAAFSKERKGELDTDMKPRADVGAAADRPSRVSIRSADMTAENLVAPIVIVRYGPEMLTGP